MRKLQVTSSYTNKTRSFQLYTNELDRIPPVSTDQKVQLARRAKNGDVHARNELVQANLRFVISVAKQYQHQGLPLEDLVSEGNIGLIRAAERFDETKGFAFISYAVWWIRRSILLALNDYGKLIRIPYRLNWMKQHISDSVERFHLLEGHEPTVEDIAVDLRMSVQDVEKGLVFIRLQDPVSLDEPIPGFESERTLLDQLPTEESYTEIDTEDRRTTVMRVIKSVVRDERNQAIIISLYGLNGCDEMTTEQLAKREHLTPERITQINRSFIQRVQASKRAMRLLTA